MLMATTIEKSPLWTPVLTLDYTITRRVNPIVMHMYYKMYMHLINVIKQCIWIYAYRKALKALFTFLFVISDPVLSHVYIYLITQLKQYFKI